MRIRSTGGLVYICDTLNTAMHANSHDKADFEYNQITDQIFIGTNFCCQAHFDHELLGKGITTEISLEGEEVDAPFGVEFFCWIPVADNRAPTTDQFTLGISTLTTLVTMGKKVYVHCKHGHGRAPTLVAAYFISKGYTVLDAVAKIKEKRPVMHLNETQMRALGEFQEQVI